MTRPLPGDTQCWSGARRCTGCPGGRGRAADTPKGESKQNTDSTHSKEGVESVLGVDTSCRRNDADVKLSPPKGVGSRAGSLISHSGSFWPPNAKWMRCVFFYFHILEACILSECVFYSPEHEGNAIEKQNFIKNICSGLIPAKVFIQMQNCVYFYSCILQIWQQVVGRRDVHIRRGERRGAEPRPGRC